MHAATGDPAVLMFLDSHTLLRAATQNHQLPPEQSMCASHELREEPHLSALLLALLQTPPMVATAAPLAVGRACAAAEAAPPGGSWRAVPPAIALHTAGAPQDADGLGLRVQSVRNFIMYTSMSLLLVPEAGTCPPHVIALRRHIRGQEKKTSHSVDSLPNLCSTGNAEQVVPYSPTGSKDWTSCSEVSNGRQVPQPATADSVWAEQLPATPWNAQSRWHGNPDHAVQCQTYDNPVCAIDHQRL